MTWFWTGTTFEIRDEKKTKEEMRDQPGGPTTQKGKGQQGQNSRIRLF